MRIICVSGKAQHGKDTCAGIMQRLLEERGKRARIIHYADLLKYLCKTYFDWNGEKDDYGRTLLQRVGTDTVRAQKPNYWVDFVIDFLKLFPNEWDYVLIPDTRFPNEVFSMKEAFPNTIHVRVIRPNFDNGLSIEQQKHISETALDEIQPDGVIMNDGSPRDLLHSVNKFIDMIGGEN